MTWLQSTDPWLYFWESFRLTSCETLTLQWRHNGHNSVSNYQPHDCLLNRLFRRRSKKTSKLRANGLCAGNSSAIGEFHAQMASNAENVSNWWRHHECNNGNINTMHFKAACLFCLCSDTSVSASDNNVYTLNYKRGPSESRFSTLRPKQHGCNFADDIFKRIFLNENVWMAIEISLNFIPKGPINYNPALAQIVVLCRPDDKPLSEIMMVILPTHICVTRPQWAISIFLRNALGRPEHR